MAIDPSLTGNTGDDAAGPSVALVAPHSADPRTSHLQQSARRSKRLSIAHLQRWTAAEVRDWVISMGLSAFAHLFEEQNIGGDVLLDITGDDLIDMGVTRLGDRKRILKALTLLKSQVVGREGPRLDVAILRASPLVQARRGAEPIELESINFCREQDRLCSIVRNNIDENAVLIEVGTFDALSRILQLGTLVLSLTSYVTPQGRLLLEKPTGEAAEFDAGTVLPDMLGHGRPGDTLQREIGGGGSMPVCIVFCLCGQGALEVARACLRNGTRHIVLLHRPPGKSYDSFSRMFSAVFFDYLLQGRTVLESFTLATSAAQRYVDRRSEGGQREIKLLPEDVPGRHEVSLFKPSLAYDTGISGCDEIDEEDEDDRESVENVACLENVAIAQAGLQPQCTPSSSPKAESDRFSRTFSRDANTVDLSGGSVVGSNDSSTKSNRSQTSQIRTVGRQIHTWRVIMALTKSRCVVVCGVGGVGKAELCRCVASHLEQRSHHFCERGVHIVRLRGIGAVDAAAAQLRHVLDDAEVLERNHSTEDGTLRCESSDDETWEALAARLGERLLVLNNVEELLHSQARAFSNFLATLLNSGPRLRILLTSRRKVQAPHWPVRSNQLPFHVHLSQLEPRHSAQLLQELVPMLGSECIVKIAGLCGHLPLTLKLVGQRLLAASDPIAEANDFIAETQSPDKRSMLFSECIAPYVWRQLDVKRRTALAALSVFRGCFEPPAAAAVLDIDAEQTKTLLQEFQDQCLIERPSDDFYYMPTSVHLLVQQKLGAAVKELEGSSSTPDVRPVNLERVGERLVIHVAALLKEVARATASDRGKGGAGLEALRYFDKNRGDIDLALTLAGTSDFFVFMVQLGRDVFDTRFSAQRRVDIYERLLGFIMAAQKVPNSCAKAKPASAPRIKELLRAFEKKTTLLEPNDGKSPKVERIRSTPVGKVNSIESIPRTTPTTPMASRTITLTDDEGDVSPPFCSKSLPTSPSASSSLAKANSNYSFFMPQEKALQEVGEAFQVGIAHKTEIRPSLRRKTNDTTISEQTDPSSLPPTPKSASFQVPVHSTVPVELLGMKPTGPPKPKGENRDSGIRWPSYIFATSDRDDLMTDNLSDEQDYEEGGSDWRGVVASRPAWCSVLTVAQNDRLRPHLQRIIRSIPSGSPTNTSGSSPMGDDRFEDYAPSPASSIRTGISGRSPASSSTSPAAAKWGPSSWWHLEPTHDGALIEVLLRLGAAHAALGRFAHAAQLLRKALIRTEEAAQRSWTSSGLSGDALKAELLGTLSGVLGHQGFQQQSETMLWQARQLAKQTGHGELYLKLTCDLAEFNRKQKGNMKAAQKLFQVSLDMRIKTLGLENLDTASTLNFVGIFSAQKGDFEEAQRLITEALRIRVKLLGRWHLSVAEAYHNLAFVQDGLQHFEKAVEYYEQALKVKRKALPESHVSITDTENQLSALYTKVKRHEECVRLLRRCLDEALKAVGEQHPSTASVLVNLGHALHMMAGAQRHKAPANTYQMQLDESQALLERALSARKALFHKRHPSVAECRAYLGCLHLSKKEFGKAESHLTKAIRIYRQQYARMHPDIATWSFWLGKTQIEQRRLRRGRETLLSALSLSESLATQGGVAGKGQHPLNQENLEEIKALLNGDPTSPRAQGACPNPKVALEMERGTIDVDGLRLGKAARDAQRASIGGSSQEATSVTNFAASAKPRSRPSLLLSPSPTPSPSPSESETAPTSGMPITQKQESAYGGKDSSHSATPLVSPCASGGLQRSSEQSSASSSSISSTDENATTSGGRGSTYDDGLDGGPSCRLSIPRIMRRVRRSAKEYEYSHRGMLSSS